MRIPTCPPRLKLNSKSQAKPRPTTASFGAWFAFVLQLRLVTFRLFRQVLGPEPLQISG
jgi:hypothetical protein